MNMGGPSAHTAHRVPTTPLNRPCHQALPLGQHPSRGSTQGLHTPWHSLQIPTSSGRKEKPQGRVHDSVTKPSNKARPLLKQGRAR